MKCIKTLFLKSGDKVYSSHYGKGTVRQVLYDEGRYSYVMDLRIKPLDNILGYKIKFDKSDVIKTYQSNGLYNPTAYSVQGQKSLRIRKII